MGTLTAFEWISLDGVFDADSMVEWFFPYDSLDRRIFIRQTYGEADGLLMGRYTYEMLAPGWSSMGPDEMDGLAGVLTQTPKYVASAHGPVANWGETILFDGDTVAEVKKIKEQVGHLMLIGSRTVARELAQAGLIDDYCLLVQPHVVGRGERIWTQEMRATLKLTKIQQFDPGQLVLRYQRIRS